MLRRYRYISTRARSRGRVHDPLEVARSVERRQLLAQGRLTGCTSTKSTEAGQICLGLRAAQALDYRLDLWRVAKEANAAANAAARLQAERGLRFLIVAVRQHARDRVDGAGALEESLPLVAVGRHAT